MSEPKWLARDDVELIHEEMIKIGGGSHGLRDAALLESALARPQNLHAYGEDDTFQLAASYAEGIARNHPFVDGNKRTAFAAADVFLAENGQNLDKVKGLEHVEMMEKLGQGQITREDAAEHLREHSRPLERERTQEQPTGQTHATAEDQSLRRSAREQMQEQQDRSRGRGR
jgi:death-on-curing protein|tara:strand:- start:2946 stop:3461 length:516 start_codon:yes stop_codon:yes gene_type:complete